jgi:polysaccharide biosynthesis protein PslG
MRFLKPTLCLFILSIYVLPLGMIQVATAQGNLSPTAQTTPQAGSIKYIPDNPYGVNVFLQKEVEPWKVEQTIRMAAAANIQWIKQEFPWDEIEFKKGYFFDDKWQKSSWEKYDQIVNLATEYGLRVIARIDHPPAWAKSSGGKSPLNSNKDLSNFANALLDRYKGQVNYVQIWNEPNLAAEWIPGQAVDPAQYAAMLKAVYPAIKNSHPNAVVLSAPMAMTLEGPESRGNMNELDYWTGMYDAGVQGNFDIASANGYGLDQPPDAPPDPKVLNFRRVELLHDIMVKNGDDKVPVWFSEYGWNASPDTLPQSERDLWRHVTPQQQAEWTVAGVDYAREHWQWAGVISIWYLRQVGDIPPDKAEYYFQMIDPAFVPQPVYNSVKVDASNYPGPASKALPTITNPGPSPTAAPEQPTATAVTVASTPSEAAAATSQPTPSAVATVTQPTVTATSVPGTPSGASSSTGNSSFIMYLAGGLLVAGGLAGLAVYFARGRG